MAAGFCFGFLCGSQSADLVTALQIGPQQCGKCWRENQQQDKDGRKAPAKRHLGRLFDLCYRDDIRCWPGMHHRGHGHGLCFKNLFHFHHPYNLRHYCPQLPFLHDCHPPMATDGTHRSGAYYTFCLINSQRQNGICEKNHIPLTVRK